MELRHYVMVARRWAWLVLLAGLIAGGSAYLVTSRQTKLYRATALMFINQPQAPADPVSGVDVSSSQNLAPTYAAMATSWPVLRKAATAMGLDPEKTAIQATASVPLNTQLLSLTVTSPSRQFAMNAANAASQAFVDTVKETQLLDTDAVQRDLSNQLTSIQSNMQKTTDQLNALGGTNGPEASGLQSQLTQQQQTYATVSGQIAQLKIAQSKVDNGVHIVAPARQPGSPFSPRPVFNALLATLLGLVAGAGLALMMEYLDDRVQTPHDVETAGAGAATLGIVEQMHGGEAGVDRSLLLELKHSSSRGLEAYRLLRSNFEFVSADSPVRSLVVTSARPHEGKTTTAANLAIVLAQAGKRVLIVDADFRRPSLHRLFGVPNAAGLSTLFLQPDIPVASLGIQTAYENLMVLPTGPLPPESR